MTAAARPDVAEAPCAEDIGREDAVAALRRWQRSGAHRRDMDEDGRYAHSCAIQIMDAWWPLLVEGIFKPTLGEKLYDLRLDLGGIDNEPNNGGAHLGSAYQGGFYGYVEKDLRTILGEEVRGKYSRIYCGGDRTDPDPPLAACRAVLEDSLAEALEVDRQTLYGDDEVCSENDDDEVQETDQYCFDSIYHTPAGAITQPLIHWINRPTFQQVVEVQQSVPRDDGDDGRGGRNGGDDEPGGGDGGPDRGVGEPDDGGEGGDDEPTVESEASRSGRAASQTVGVGAADGAGGGGNLPFTGLGLAVLALAGLALVGGGLVLRRAR